MELTWCVPEGGGEEGRRGGGEEGRRDKENNDGAGRTDNINGKHVGGEGLEVDKRHVLAQGMVPRKGSLDPIACPHTGIECGRWGVGFMLQASASSVRG